VARASSALAALGLLLAAAGSADAQSGSLAVSLTSTAPGALSDAAPAQITASGTSPANAILYVHYRRSGTGGCAVSPDVDNGTPLPLDGTQLGTGAFSVSTAATEAFPVGSYLVCGWLENAGDPTEIFADFSTTFAVGAADTLGLSAVADTVEGRPVDVTAAGKAYAQGAVVTPASRSP